MTDETRELFDAPWTIYGEPDDYSFVLQDASEDEIATIFTTDEANRIARLPELYDALLDSVRRICSTCIGSNLSDMPLDDIGMFCRANCEVHKYIALLKNVRDGK